MDTVFEILEKTPEASNAAIETLAEDLTIVIISTIDELIQKYFGEDSVVVLDKVFQDVVVITGHGNEVTTRHR
jgi:hypothetical protein